MCLLQGEIPKGDMGFKGLKLKNINFAVFFVKKQAKSVSQFHVFTLEPPLDYGWDEKG